MTTWSDPPADTSTPDETPTVDETPTPEPPPAPVDELDVDLQDASTWYAPNQQCVRPGETGPAAVYATGATAGIPGAWTPAGADVPNSPETLMAGEPFTITAAPATPWTTGQFVQTETPGAAGRVCWTGAAWVGGAAP